MRSERFSEAPGDGQTCRASDLGDVPGSEVQIVNPLLAKYPYRDLDDLRKAHAVPLHRKSRADLELRTTGASNPVDDLEDQPRAAFEVAAIAVIAPIEER